MLGSPDVGGRSVRAATRANRFGAGRHGPMRQMDKRYSARPGRCQMRAAGARATAPDANS
jgi:hypothetical protein